MKKKNVLILAGALASLSLTSCFKSEVDPGQQKTSQLKINNIVFQNLTTNSNTRVSCSVSIDFYVSNGTTNDIIDTLRFADSFAVVNPLGQNQSYDFDTPVNTKKLKYNMNFRVLGGGVATGVTLSQVLYKWNGTSYIDKSLPFSSTDGKLFTTDPQFVNF